MSEADRDLLKDALLKIRSLKAELQARDQAATDPIAIVGIGCRFPGGADTPEAFWHLLQNGVDSVRDLPAGRWHRDAYFDPTSSTPGTAYVRQGGFLETASVSGFDADFFGIAPREALRLDPQQRLLLEVAWEALEHAGITPASLATRAAGVYVGAMSADYGHRQAHQLQPRDIDPYMLTGNDLSFAAGRLSYFLGLHGPAMVISTACSSSLVAVHLAMQAIRAGECEIALAGGVNVVLDPTTSVMLSQLRALAPDGRCKSFDARADGYGRGEGCGIVVLERLSVAIERGHRIIAVLRGSAVNHDGPSAGLTVPNGSAQEALLRRACAVARVKPTDLDYVEAHGTGTALGDPIEINALARAVGSSDAAAAASRRRVLIGSVKTNIGHLEPAAGIAGLIKVALALHHRQLPPSLHFETPSTHVDWNSVPIEVVTRLREWPAAEGRTPIAGISSFGLSGVNAHIIMQSAPPQPAQPATSAPPAPIAPIAHVLPLSARTPEALDDLIGRYESWLSMQPDTAWPAICHTATLGRTHFAHRAAVVAESITEARARLRDLIDRRRTSAQPADALPHRADRETATEPGRRSALERLAEAYIAGREIDWLAQNPVPSATTSGVATLPTYPFQRQTYWVLEDTDARITPDGQAPEAAAFTNAAPAGAALVDARRAGSAPSSGEQDLRKQLASLPTADARLHVIREELDHQTRAVLGLSLTASLDRERSLLSLGLDSLMSVELRDRLRARLGVAPALDELLGGATLMQVGTSLGEALNLPLAEAAAAAAADPADALRRETPAAGADANARVGADAKATAGPNAGAAAGADVNVATAADAKAFNGPGAQPDAKVANGPDARAAARAGAKAGAGADARATAGPNTRAAAELDATVAALPAARRDGSRSDMQPPADIQNLPLSYGQKALWFIHHSQPASAAYNVGVALRIHGIVDGDAIEKAFRQLIARHPALRTIYASDNGEPYQRILPPDAVPFDLRRVDAGGWSDERLSDAVHRDYRRPFDLTQGPLLRVSLYRQFAHTQVLLLTMHHIGCDAQSCWTLLEELQVLMAGGTLAPLGATCAEFVGWQRELIEGAEGTRLETFWRRQLSGELPVLDLPTDRPRPPMPSFRGASKAVLVPPALAASVKQLARDQDATLFVTLLAAFQVLLHRYSGQDDITIGSATSGRPREWAGTVGYFVNPVPLRADLSGNPTFAAVLRQARTTVTAAMAHQDLPFPVLVERLQPRRSARHAPIFQADFSLSTLPRALAGGTLSWSRFELAEEEGQFEIGLHAVDEEGHLRLIVKYDTDLFDAGTIDGMMASFLALLAASVANPQEHIDALRLLSPTARQRLLTMGVGPRVPEPVPAAFAHHLFEQQTQRTPDAIAVELWQNDERLTYRDLDRRANTLAAALRHRGVGPDCLVGVCLRPSIDLAVALLAVLKAGGAYVPIDPGYPAERVAFMLRDADPRALISTRALQERLPATSTNTSSTIWIEDIATIDIDSEPFATTVLTPDHLAYVIYTSGSTGQPKGAMITHRGLSNYLTWALDEYRVDEGCGAPVSSSIAFDATITSFFAPLLAGGTITLLPDDEMIDALADVLRRDRVYSLVKITPAHLDVLAQQLAERPGAGRVNAFVIGGEALRSDSLQFWLRTSPQTRLINEYGPTETVVGCCVHEASTRDAAGAAVPIGRPIANTQLYVLDAQREPVPPGVLGELYIGGAGVARGYLHRPDLTAARFIDDPFSNDRGARLYRTGDLARWRRDGVLDYVGRIDTQIKIRGFRIEPGEIETALTAHPGVADALVLAREIGRTGKQLVAYIVAATDQAPAPAAHELRRHLASTLPEHMVPAAFVTLEAFPLTPNGKVDRAALPAPVASPNDRRELAAPRDTLEMALAALWSELLGLGAVDIHDNFFDLGGHSLLAVRLMARIAADLGYRAPLATILRGPTIAELARQLRQISADADADEAIASRSPLVPIQIGGTRPPFFCIPGAGGNPIYLQHLARHLGSDQPFFGLQGAGVEDDAPPHTTVEAMATHYLDAMASIASPDAGYHLVGHSLGGWVAFEMARQLRRRGYPVPLVAIIDTPAPFVGDVSDRADWDESRWIAELASRIGQLLAPDLRLDEAALRACENDAARLALFRDTLIAAGAFPPEGEAASLRRTLDVFKAHAQVAYRVDPEGLAGAEIERLVLLRTNTPPSQTPWAAGDETWGWGRLALTDVCCVPGDHLAVLRPPHVATLAERLAAYATATATPMMTAV